MRSASVELASEGYSGEPGISALVSLRYLGQNYEEDIPVDLDELQRSGFETIFDGFHQHHQERYGYHIAGEVIEIVALKVTLLGSVPKPRIAPSLQAGKTEPFEDRQVYFKGDGWLTCPIYHRAELAGQVRIDGPAIIEEYGSTTLVEPGQELHVDDHGIILIQVTGGT